MRILVISGPNINLLGLREPEIYGRKSYSTLCADLTEHAKKLGVQAEIYQSNHEGDLVDAIQHAYRRADGIVLNPAGYTHTSVAIADALAAVQVPTVEVHISDVSKREDFRQISYVRPYCLATIAGHGTDGYLEAMTLLKEKYDNEHKN